MRNLKISEKLLVSFIFSIFFAIIYAYPSNIPFVDDWEEIYHLFFSDKLDYLTSVNSAGHTFFIYRLLLLLNYLLFQLNFQFFFYLSLILLLISYLMISKYIINKKISLIFLSLLLFNPKIFPIITQTVNIVWTINFIIIIGIVVSLQNQNFNFRRISIIYILSLISIINFGAGLAICLFLFIYFLIKPLKFRFYSILFLSPIIIYFFILQNSGSEFVPDGGVDSISSSFNLLFNYETYITLFFDIFAILGGFFIPWFKPFSIIGFLIGFSQFLIIIFFFIKTIHGNFFSSLKNFFEENPILFISILLAALISFSRPGDSYAVRYHFCSILFQISFINYLFKQENIKLLKNLFSFSLVITFCFMLFAPYTGFHWQMKRNSIFENVKNCYLENQEKCSELTYQETFYGGNWYDYEKFKKAESVLYKKRLNYFNDI